MERLLLRHTRTFYCKSVDDEQAAIHDLVRTAVEKAEAVIKPGMRFCDIDAQARDLIDEADTVSTGESVLDTSSDRKTTNMVM